MKKKPALIGGIILVIALLVGGGIFAFTKMNDKPAVTKEENTKKKVAEPLNVIPVAERPYVKIMPEADGRNVTLQVDALKKDATNLDYELEYQSGSLLQGAFGALQLGTLPAKVKILLGSCSAGGACTYHEDVMGGTLLTRYEGPENYALKSDWKYIENTAKETAHSSKDAKFQIDSAALGRIPYLVIFNTPGYPEGLEGTPVSEIYSLTSSQALTGKASLTIRANEDGATSIMGWDGKAWKTFTGTVDGKMITAEVDLMELYVAVK